MKPGFVHQPGCIRCTFTLTHSDFHIIQKYAGEKGWDAKDTSAALHLILHEWKEWKEQQSHSLLISRPVCGSSSENN